MSVCFFQQGGSFKERTLSRIRAVLLKDKKEVIIQEMMEFVSSLEDAQINSLWNKICIKENYIKDTDLDWKCFI